MNQGPKSNLLEFIMAASSQVAIRLQAFLTPRPRLSPLDCPASWVFVQTLLKD